MIDLNEKAKKAFSSKDFVSASKHYDEALGTLDAFATAALVKKAGDLLDTSQNNPSIISTASCLASFILRLKPFYFEAIETHVRAAKTCPRLLDTSKFLLKFYLSKDGTDEEAKRLLDSLVDEGSSEASAILSLTDVSYLEDADVLLTDEVAKLVGNILNNVALCQLKVGKFNAAASSACQALLFLSSPDARIKALFRIAHALAMGGHIESAESAIEAAESSGLKKAEVRILKENLNEGKGKHLWAKHLQTCLRDDKKQLDCSEFLSEKISIGVSTTKGLGIVANSPITKGDVLLVQQPVHFVPPTSATDCQDHINFSKHLLAKVLENPVDEAAIRLVAMKGSRPSKEELPTITTAFRHLPYLPFLYDQLQVTQLREEAKRIFGEMPIKVHEGSSTQESEGRKLASIISGVVQRLPRGQASSLAMTFEDRYKKTMTQSGGSGSELGQMGLWPIPTLMHHSDYPTASFGTLGGVGVVVAIRDMKPGDSVTLMMAGIQCLKDRQTLLKSMNASFNEGFDPDFPLTPAEVDLSTKLEDAFEKANQLKMDTVGLDPSEGIPYFDKAIDVCLGLLKPKSEALLTVDPLGVAALYFTLADCLGGKKDLSGMVKAYYMGVKAAHSAIVVNLDTLTRMTKMQKFIPMAKKLEQMQDQAEMVAKNNPSLKEEFAKIARIKEIGPSIETIQSYLEQHLHEGCKLVFATTDAYKLLC